MGTLHDRIWVCCTVQKTTNFDIWVRCTITKNMWDSCTFNGKHIGPLHECKMIYVGMLHESSVLSRFCGQKGGAMWITMDKIRRYVGMVHGNLWVCCT